ncbi:TIGR00730 family Rossman fold protein [Sphingoaurantiacus capsulatus]|uniref:Cytokinin riboside 5'-monophosphate phosphoribohydrolase n=1 Tax=Sphingoaurantiacus capsulatus TaxID=1771310 RepID=A0ABV7XFE1_9SPHN
MTRIRSLCLFCGSRPGADPAHAETADALGRLLAANGITLVYGGGAVGLMGIAARAVKKAGGSVVGVIPRTLMRDEIAQQGLDELIVVETLHERKALMHLRSDAFLALPGSIGTLDELFEALTWRELSIHGKPIWLLGANGYWSPFMALLRHLDTEGFAPADLFDIVEELPGLPALAERLI